MLKISTHMTLQTIYLQLLITTYDDYGNIVKINQRFVTRTVKITYEEKSQIRQTKTQEDKSSDNSDNIFNDNAYSAV